MNIFGAINPDLSVFEPIIVAAGDRRRDSYGLGTYMLDDGATAMLGTWRELAPQVEPQQPFEGVVAAGLALPGEPPGLGLPRLLARASLAAFAESLGLLQGDLAIGCLAANTVYLGTTHVALYVLRQGDGVYFSTQAIAGCEVLEPLSAMDLRTGELVLLPRTWG